MRKLLFTAMVLAVLGSAVAGQERASQTIEITGTGSVSEANKITPIWLYPEDYEGKTIKLCG